MGNGSLDGFWKAAPCTLQRQPSIVPAHIELGTEHRNIFVSYGDTG